ncbi:hypothetical protein V1278_002596 [Bradyrhizobium sp. AZCC 1577]
MKNGAWANIPSKSNRNNPICFSPYLYRNRNGVERFFNRIKQCRRVATRYDKLAANYLAFVQLASIRLWLRANEVMPLNACLFFEEPSYAFHLSHFIKSGRLWSAGRSLRNYNLRDAQGLSGRWPATSYASRSRF